MFRLTRSMSKNKNLAKKNKVRLLPPIRVCLSDNTIISKSDGPPKKGMFTFFLELFFTSS